MGISPTKAIHEALSQWDYFFNAFAASRRAFDLLGLALGKLRRLQNICSRLYLVRGVPEIKKPSSQKDGAKTFVRFFVDFSGMV